LLVQRLSVCQDEDAILLTPLLTGASASDQDLKSHRFDELSAWLGCQQRVGDLSLEGVPTVG
jgi:hypothetical protein